MHKFLSAIISVTLIPVTDIASPPTYSELHLRLKNDSNL